MLREITSIDIKPAFLQRNKNDQEIFVETPKEAGENLETKYGCSRSDICLKT